MKEEEYMLRRKLAAGFEDSLTPEERKAVIASSMSLEEIEKRYGTEKHREAVEQVMRWLENTPDCGIWWYTDADYPCFEGAGKRLPYMLFYEGRRPVCKGLTDPDGGNGCVGIIGTRKADYRGLHQAFVLGLEAAANGISVVSGMAEGCDQAALEGAISAHETGVEGTAPCYAVLGCGLEFNYPYSSGALKRRIRQCGGAVISRFAPGMPPLRHNFPGRNMVIAAMCRAVCVVQAPLRSGALITADFALQMGKEVYTGTEGLGKRACRAGTQRMADDGCPVIRHIGDADFLSGTKDGGVLYAGETPACKDVRYRAARFCDRFYSLSVCQRSEFGVKI